MPADDITRQLAQMLGQGDSEDQAAEREPEAPPSIREALQQEVRETRQGGFSPTPEQAADDPSAYYGRGPTGRLRNFRAMNDGKLRTTFDQVRYENNDSEAMTAICDEMEARGMEMGR